MKQIRLRSEQINSTYLVGQQSYVLNTNGQTVVSIAVENQVASPGNLLIGLNEDPSPKLFLQAGESRSFGPYRDGDLLNDNELRFAWSTNDILNIAVIVVSFEGDKPLC